MASSQEFVDHVVEQFDSKCGVTDKKMFGEYGLFSGGKMFALICDDQLFIKPTAGGREYIGTPVEAPPYPGAKSCFLIDRLDDRAWLSELARISVRELPVPRPRKKKK